MAARYAFWPNLLPCRRDDLSVSLRVYLADDGKGLKLSEILFPPTLRSFPFSQSIG
jgi:hypothetical protein